MVAADDWLLVATNAALATMNAALATSNTGTNTAQRQRMRHSTPRAICPAFNHPAGSCKRMPHSSPRMQHSWSRPKCPVCKHVEARPPLSSLSTSATARESNACKTVPEKKKKSCDTSGRGRLCMVSFWEWSLVPAAEAPLLDRWIAGSVEEHESSSSAAGPGQLAGQLSRWMAGGDSRKGNGSAEIF